MQASRSHGFPRWRRLNTYTAYSVGCAIAWGVVWALAASDGKDLGKLLLVFLGWVIGWTSATIARRVYPPPRKWQRLTEAPGPQD
jgi:hypothetical protein